MYIFLAKENDSAKHGLFQWLCPSCHGEAPKTLCLQQTNELINVVNAQNHKIENLEIQMAKLISIIGASFDQPDLKFGQIQNGGSVKDSDSEKVNDSKPHNFIAHCSKTFAEAVSSSSAKLDTSQSTNSQVSSILNAGIPAIKLVVSNKKSLSLMK